jgi:hypothetical protein
MPTFYTTTRILIQNYLSSKHRIKISDKICFSKDLQFINSSESKSQNLKTIVAVSKTLKFSTSFKSAELETECARIKIINLVDHIGARPKQEINEATLRLYSVTIKNNFNSGITDDQVIAVCCYLVCRKEKKSIYVN